MDSMKIETKESTNMEEHCAVSTDANKKYTEDSHFDMEEDLRIKSLYSALEETCMKFQCINKDDIDFVFERFGVYAPSSQVEDYGDILTSCIDDENILQGTVGSMVGKSMMKTNDPDLE